MITLDDLIDRKTEVAAVRPWPRYRVSREAWLAAAASLADGDHHLVALWGETGTVHMALSRRETGEIRLLSIDCADGGYPSVADVFPPAVRLERAIRDLCGLEALGATDRRLWLDHDQWGVKTPLGVPRPAPVGAATAYPFLAAEGESLHQIPVGPVHAGIIEPGHFRFTANGETVVRLEQRLGYVHKGIEALMMGADLDRGARIAGRVSGDSTLAYSLAFARSVEAALQIDVPLRAIWLRALMAELERLANHLGDIGAICNDAAYALMHAHCGVLREDVLRAAHACFGHRLMMDRIVPGGIATDLDVAGIGRLRDLVRHVQQRFPELVELYENTVSLQDRTVGTGILKPELARRFGCGGFIGRASERNFDARKQPGYPPYDALSFAVPVLNEGDVEARVWVRIREVEQSLSIIVQVLDHLPQGPVRAELPAASGAVEGAALIEGFRGDIFVWIRIAGGGKIDRCHLRDPSWFQWPLLEAVIEGNIVADFPLCNKSFNCSYSGHDG
ncbi:MAG: hydrogenase large subunit [Hyphomicrobium sp.]